jgi:uncharacterized membrane protein
LRIPTAALEGIKYKGAYMKVFGNRGDVHIMAMVGAVLVVFMAYVAYRNSGSSDRLSYDPQADRSSAEAVRQMSYTMIDLHGKFLKMQVDAMLATWESMSPERKQKILDYVASGINEARKNIENVGKTGATH